MSLTIDVNPGNHFYQENLGQAIKYTAISALSIGALGLFYYFNICDLDRDFTTSCGSSLQSFKINVGLPLVALGAARKAKQLFQCVRN
jgi:hypothetical protein